MSPGSSRGGSRRCRGARRGYSEDAGLVGDESRRRARREHSEGAQVGLLDARLVGARHPARAFVAATHGDDLILEPLAPDARACRAAADAARESLRVAASRAKSRRALAAADAQNDPTEAALKAEAVVGQDNAAEALDDCVRTFAHPACLVAVLDVAARTATPQLAARARELARRPASFLWGVRGTAATVTWIFRGDGSRRRRGCHVDIPRGRVAAWSRHRRGCRVDIPRRQVAAPPRLPRGYSEGG